MAETSTFYKDALGMGETLIKQAYDRAAQTLNDNLDDYFRTQVTKDAYNEALAAGVRPENFQFDYKREDYLQYTVTEKQDATSIVSKLRSEGYTQVIATPTKIGDSYIVLVPKTAESSVLDYASTFDVDIHEKSNDTNAVGLSSHEDDASLGYHKLIINNLDELGMIWNKTFQTYDMMADHINNAVTIRVDKNNRLHYFVRDKEITITTDNLGNDRVFLNGKEVKDERYANALKESVNTAKADAAAKLSEQVPGLDKTAKTADDIIAKAQYKIARNEQHANSLADVFKSKINGYQVKIVRDNPKTVNASKWQFGKLQNISEKIVQEDIIYAGAPDNKKPLTLHESLKKSFGSLAEGTLTPASLVAINSEFLKKANEQGIYVVSRTGRFDEKVFDAITPDQWKKMGIDSQSQAMLRDVNQAKFGAVGTSYRTLLTKKGVMKAVDDEDTQKAISTGQSGIRLTKDTVKEYRRNTEANRYRRQTKKLEKAQEKNITPKAKKTKPKKDIKYSSSRKKIQEKYAQKMDKKAALTTKRREGKGLSNRLHNRVNGIQKRLSESRLGRFLGRATDFGNKIKKKTIAKLAPALLHLVVIVAIPILIISALMMIANLFEDGLDKVAGVFGKLDADTYKDSAFYSIYEALDEAESNWVNNLWIKHMNEPETRKNAVYGTRFAVWDSYKQYHSNEFVEVEDVLYADPFGVLAKDGVCDQTPELKFDGTKSVQILTNDNIYNATPSDKYGTRVDLATAQTGHTSNLKDILAMVDVMYGNDINTGSNTSMNLLGKTPYGLNWEDFKAKIYNAFLWCKMKFLCWFNDSKSDEEWYNEYMSGKRITASYKSVLSYALMLFSGSHQSRIDLEVEYYDVIPEKERLTTYKDAAQSDVSAKGLCVRPATSTFFLFYQNGRVHPSVDRDEYKPTDAGNYKIGADQHVLDITMDMMCENETPCIMDVLPNGAKMGSNKETYNYIRSDACWNFPPYNRPQNGTTVASDQIYRYTDKNGKTGLCTEYVIPFTIQDPPTSKSSITLEKVIKQYSREIETSIKPKIVADTLAAYQKAERNGVFRQDVYSLSADKNEFTVKQYGHRPNESEFTVEEKKEEDGTVLDENRKWVYELKWVSMNETKVNGKTTKIYTAYLVVKYLPPEIEMKTTTYHRNCIGHSFEYCAGHICTKVTGIVYSITNEQVMMVNTGSKTTVSMDFDAEKLGYDHIEGKIDENALIKDKNATIEQLVGSAKGININRSPQGSVIGAKGLNLYTGRDSHGQLIWASGMQMIHENPTYFSLMRDIFDIDMMILKGNDVFPLRYPSEYEGWTATNMTLAIGKYSGDWIEQYGFDIPTSIGGQVQLKNDIIEGIIEELKSNYSSNFTEERERGVRMALSLVGQGVYLESSQTSGTRHSHDFLTSTHPCSAWELKEGDLNYESFGDHKINYTVSCMGGNEEDFLTYLWKYMGGLSENERWPVNGNGKSPWASNTGDSFCANVLPGDILHYSGTDSWEQKEYLNPEQNNEFEELGLHIGLTSNPFMDIEKSYIADAYNYGDRDVFFIGTLEHPVPIGYNAEGDTIWIPKGVPITIELQRTNSSDMFGCICLHWHLMEDDSSRYRNKKDIYPWLLKQKASSFPESQSNNRLYDGTVTYYHFQKREE